MAHPRRASRDPLKGAAPAAWRIQFRGALDRGTSVLLAWFFSVPVALAAGICKRRVRGLQMVNEESP